MLFFTSTGSLWFHFPYLFWKPSIVSLCYCSLFIGQYWQLWIAV